MGFQAYPSLQISVNLCFPWLNFFAHSQLKCSHVKVFALQDRENKHNADLREKLLSSQMSREQKTLSLIQVIPFPARSKKFYRNAKHKVHSALRVAENALQLVKLEVTDKFLCGLQNERFSQNPDTVSVLKSAQTNQSNIYIYTNENKQSRSEKGLTDGDGVSMPNINILA